MRLEETSEAAAWLRQFETVDREVARQLLRSLVLVSQSDFEANLQHAVESVLAKISGQNAALMTVPEPPSEYDSEGERRVAGSSADRVKHLIENLHRVHGDRVSANPTVNSMRAQRVKNIIFVEDFVGSGDRITRYWRNEVGPSIKSWASYGWTKIWVVSYAGLERGLKAIVRRMPVTNDRIVTVLPGTEKRLQLTEPMLRVAEKYGRKVRGEMWAGYSGGGGTLVFQHGCPNNALAMLWASGGRFKPIFPDRGIPPALQACFGAYNANATAEVLWSYNQYLFALRVIDDIKHQNATPGQMRLAVALGLASAHGRWEDQRLQAQLALPLQEIENLRYAAYRLSMIDNQNHKVTAFGRDLLSRLKRPGGAKKKPKSQTLPSLEQLYYPDSCGGVAKH